MTDYVVGRQLREDSELQGELGSLPHPSLLGIPTPSLTLWHNKLLRRSVPRVEHSVQRVEVHTGAHHV